MKRPVSSSSVCERPSNLKQMLQPSRAPLRWSLFPCAQKHGTFRWLSGFSIAQPRAPGNLTSLVDNPGAALNATVAAPLTITTLDKHMKSPVRWNWNVTVQQELPFSSTLSIAYVGGRGLHNWRTFDINQPTVGALQANPHNKRQLSPPLPRLCCDSAGEERRQVQLQLAAGSVEPAVPEGAHGRL